MILLALFNCFDTIWCIIKLYLENPKKIIRSEKSVNLFRLNRQDLEPQLVLSEAQQSISYLDLQPRATTALLDFIQDPTSSLLVIKGESNVTLLHILENFLLFHLPKTEQLQGVNYRILHQASGEYKITLEPAKSVNDNFAARYQVKTAVVFDENSLFGYILQPPFSSQLHLQPGLVQQTNGGILLLPVTPFLDNPTLWQRLETMLLSQQFEWISNNPLKPLPCHIPGYPLALKVILVGNREELALLNELSPQLYTFAKYSELDYYLSLKPHQDHHLQLQNWGDYIQSLVATIPNKAELKPTISLEAINRLYQLSIRESEDRNLLPLSTTLFNQLRQIYRYSKNPTQIEISDVEYWWLKQKEQCSPLQQLTYAEILNEHIYIATDGEEIGQINGLTVIEYAGLPYRFGEPCRISCIVRFGEGEFLDIERKNELAGNLHAKGMMIAESCLANLLELQAQLPFSASLVFEQSYSEIDGDSASLAAFCVLCSALAESPLPQYIAITGSIDQFGLVHSVGGVNEKIEGFFNICQQRGLNGKQGVIIPAVVISQLSLEPDILQAIEEQQFHIWAVENVEQAVKILFQRELLIQDKPSTKASSLLELILNRIEQANGQRRLSGHNWLTSVSSKIIKYFDRLYKVFTK